MTAGTLAPPAAAPAPYRLRIPAITAWLNSNDPAGGRLWHRRHLTVQAWKDAAGWQARRAKVPRLARAHIVAELCFPNRIRRDPANFYPTVKAAVDGLVVVGVLPDDSAAYLVGPDMRLGPRVEGRIGALLLHIYPLALAEEDAMAAPPAPHDYVSTACQHDMHDRCRLVCKFCPARCRCVCHPRARGAAE